MKLTIEIDTVVDGEDTVLAHRQALDMFNMIINFNEQVRLFYKHGDYDSGTMDVFYQAWHDTIGAYNISLEP